MACRTTRTSDIFYQRIDLQRVNIPHADVHMRLFVRVIDALLADSLPLPRLWYFPGTNRTIVLPTADSHISTPSPHTALLNSAQSYGARVSLYLSRYLSIPSSTVNGWRSGGHEVGLHPYFAPDGLAGDMNGGYTVAANWWQSNYPTFPYSPTVRHHSIEWTGWADPASVLCHVRCPDGHLVLRVGPSGIQPEPPVAGPWLHQRQRPADAVRHGRRAGLAGLPAGDLTHRRAADLRRGGPGLERPAGSEPFRAS